MGRFLLVLILGSAIVAGIAWGFDLLPKSERKEKVPEPMSTPKIEFGNPLFPNAKQSVAEPVFNGTGKGLPTIVIQAHLAVMDKSDAAPQVEGQILFVGEIVPDEAVALGGVAAFSADPFSNAKVNRGTGDLIVMYRRLLEDEPLRADQNVAMLDPAKAMQEAAIRKAKVKVAEFDYEAAYKVFKEADKRYDIALKLRREGGPKVIGDEELREKQLGSEKFELEAQSKKEAIQVAINEERQALTVLRQHYVRNPTGKASKIKTIYHSRGDSVKNLEPIMTVFSTDNMMAEGMVDVQYRHRLMLDMPVIVEPTQQEPPHHIFRGHTMEINGVAVSKGPRPLFVSVSDDKKAYVWQAGQDYPVRVLPHADAVKAVACSPIGCKRNWCITSCANGSVYLWDLDAKDNKPVEVKQNKNNEPITCLAFSSDGSYFAGGGDTGLTMWKTEGLEQLDYQLDHSTEGTITAVSFTPHGKLVTASRDKMLRVWELYEKGAKLVGEPIIGRSGNVGQLDVSRDGRWMLFDQGKTLQIRSVHDGRPINTLENSSMATPFETLALFSPDASLMLTAGGPQTEGRLQLWRCPTSKERGFEVRQFITQEKAQVTCAAFANDSYAVSGTKTGNVYLWRIPTNDDVKNHRIMNARLTQVAETVDAGTRQLRVGVKLRNYDGRLIDGGPVTIVIEP